MTCRLALAVAVILPFANSASGQQQQAATTVLVANLDVPSRTPVLENGRQIGIANERIALPPGVHTLRVGSAEECIYVELGAAAELSFAAGKPMVKAAQYCRDIWSEIVIQPVASGIEIQSAGQTTRRGDVVVIRVAQPGTVRVSSKSATSAPTENDIPIGAKEIATFRLTLAPAAPTLLPDSTLLALPPEPGPPPPPSAVRQPRDPAPDLALAERRLSVVQRGRTNYHSGMFWGIIGGTSLLFSAVRGADSLTPWPQRRKSVLLSFWGGTGASLISVGGFAMSVDLKKQAGCAGSLTDCQRAVEGDITRLHAEKDHYPAAIAAADSERIRRQADYQRTLADQPRIRSEWEGAVRQVEQRNEQIRKNRSENDRRSAAWRAQVAAAGLSLVSKAKRQ